MPRLLLQTLPKPLVGQTQGRSSRLPHSRVHTSPPHYPEFLQISRAGPPSQRGCCWPHPAGVRWCLGWKAVALLGGEWDWGISLGCLRCANTLGGAERSHRATADRCAHCSPGTGQAPAQELPDPALGPWVRKLGAQPASQQLDLPACCPATSQPLSPLPLAREGAEPRASKAYDTTAPTADILGGRTENILFGYMDGWDTRH